MLSDKFFPISEKRKDNYLAKHIWSLANWDFVCKLEADGNFLQSIPSQD